MEVVEEENAQCVDGFLKKLPCQARAGKAAQTTISHDEFFVCLGYWGQCWRELNPIRWAILNPRYPESGLDP